jgi:hypothetical protein
MWIPCYSITICFEKTSPSAAKNKPICFSVKGTSFELSRDEKLKRMTYVNVLKFMKGNNNV